MQFKVHYRFGCFDYPIKIFTDVYEAQDYANSLDENEVIKKCRFNLIKNQCSFALEDLEECPGFIDITIENWENK